MTKRRPYKRMPPQEGYQIACEYRDGVKVVAIMAAHRCAMSVVIANVKKHGIPLRDPRKRTERYKVKPKATTPEIRYPVAKVQRSERATQ